jgi:hypothetical protein
MAYFWFLRPVAVTFFNNLEEVTSFDLMRIGTGIDCIEALVS